jgi:two-component system, LytTR family, response regulator
MEKKFTAIIVDDEPAACEILFDLLKDYHNIDVVATKSNVDDALVAILRHKPDFVFLDIEMPGKNGFTLVEEMKELDVNCEFVFTTGFNEHAIEAVRHSAFDFLLKPIEPSELDKCVKKIKRELPKKDFKKELELFVKSFHPKKIKFNTRTGFVLINPNEIVFCKADGNYSSFHLANGKDVTVSAQLGKILSLLPDKQFLRINQSVLINIEMLDKVDRKTRIITLVNCIECFELKASLRAIKELSQIKYF